jgi:hypothetical protein
LGCKATVRLKPPWLSCRADYRPHHDLLDIERLAQPTITGVIEECPRLWTDCVASYEDDPVSRCLIGLFQRFEEFHGDRAPDDNHHHPAIEFPHAAWLTGQIEAHPRI